MALEIRKKSLLVWKFIDTVNIKEFIPSRFSVNTLDNAVTVIYKDGANSQTYNLSEIQLYDLGSISPFPTFVTIEAFMLKLEQMNCPCFPEISVIGGVQSIVAGANVSVDNTDPLNPIVSASGGGGSSSWGGITGTLSDQTDLQITLNNKLNKVTTNDVEKVYIKNADGTQGMKDISTLVGTDYLGAITPSSTPTGTGASYWNATEPGTYTNFGGVVVNANSFAFISRSAGGVFSLSQTEIQASELTINEQLALKKTISISQNIIPNLTYFQNKALDVTGVFGGVSNNFLSLKYIDVSAFKGQNLVISNIGGVSQTLARYVIKDQLGTILSVQNGLGIVNKDNVIIPIPNIVDSVFLAFNVTSEAGSGLAFINGTSIYPEAVMLNSGSVAIPYQPHVSFLDKRKIGVITTYDNIYINFQLGNDSNSGLTKLRAVKTFSKARKLLSENGTLWAWGDFVNPIDYEISMFKNISCLNGEKCSFIYGTIFSTATLEAGKTRVYKTTFNFPLTTGYLWQKGIPDVNTLIPLNEKSAHQRNRTYRLEHTRLYKATSINEIEDTTSKLMYFKDDATNTLYFSKATSSSLLENPIIIPSASVLQGLNQINVNFNKIDFHFRSFYPKNLKGLLNDCSFGYTNRDGAIMWDYTEGLVLNNCELTSSINDGANGHYLGKIVFNNCLFHDNTDDGESTHENAVSYINGGLIEYNGNGITPASGGTTYVENAIVRNNKNKINGNKWANNEEGTGLSAQGINSTLNAINCTSIGNQVNYRKQSGCNALIINCNSISAIENDYLGFDASNKINCT